MPTEDLIDREGTITSLSLTSHLDGMRDLHRLYRMSDSSGLAQYSVRPWSYSDSKTLLTINPVRPLQAEKGQKAPSHVHKMRLNLFSSAEMHTRDTDLSKLQGVGGWLRVLTTWQDSKASSIQVSLSPKKVGKSQ